MALAILDFISSEGGSFGGRPNGLQYEWISMYAALISHSPDLQRLQTEGFVMEVCDGWLIIHHIPYVNAAREMKDGTLLMPLCISGDHTIHPNNHTDNWVGEQPCDIKGKPLPSLVSVY